MALRYLTVCFLVVTVQAQNCASNEYQAGEIDWNCAGGSSTVTNANVWTASTTVSIAKIPEGVQNLQVSVSASADLDIALYHEGACIIGYDCSQLSSSYDADGYSTTYSGMDLTYSGWTQTGAESLSVNAVSGNMELKVVAYTEMAAGDATVTYSYDSISPCGSIDFGCTPCASYSSCSAGLDPYCDGTQTVTCQAPGTGADPFTYFKGKRIQFWPPVGKRIKLLEIDGVQLLGVSKDYGSEHNNWWSDFVVSKDNKDIMHVTTSDPKYLLATEGVETPNTLDLAVLDASGTWKNLAREGSFAAADGTVSLAFKNMKKKFGRGYKQTVSIRSPEMNITVFAAKANKFKDEAEQLRFLHLDMTVDEVDMAKVTGTLPEIWGVRPLTPAVAVMLKAPEVLLV
eukprot:TRINITY_DN35369_c0_g1_i1.p1 TRINITY_DN35369_c0_g1~~TRINITY_DN35369_c0_g1_i1.p1  ORF type:complete len:400 (+),score=92.02 TRINITY_DN35369_c0_g1_i1:59-1258(+)